MKLYTMIALTALIATPAIAADAVTYNEPTPVSVDTFSWTGGYIGVNAGYAGGKFKSDFYEEFGGPSLKSNGSGFVGGIQAGYNWQINQLILGVETDIQASNLESEFTISQNPYYQTLGTKIDWFGTTRARLGYTPVDRFMIYATGGVAYGKVKTYAEANSGLYYYSSASDTRVGYTVGAGAEYAITNNVTLKTEYLYTDLGKLKLDVSNGEQTLTIGEAKSAFHTVRVGLNYKF